MNKGMIKLSKTNERIRQKERAMQAEIAYESLRGFKAVLGYLQRFPRVSQRRIINAVKIVCE